MKLLYLLLVLLALISFVKMSFYLGFMALGVMLGIFLYSKLDKKLKERHELMNSGKN